MAQIGGVTFSPGDRENLFEMQCLRRANDIPDRVRFQLVDPIIDRGDIGCSVIESAVPFANDQRLISQLGIIAEEHDHGAFADLRYPGFEQTIYHAGQPIVVKTFAALEVVMNVEQFVNALEILHRKRDAFVPNIRVFFVAGLQFHQFLATRFTHFRIVCSLVRLFPCKSGQSRPADRAAAPVDPKDFSNPKSPSRTVFPSRRRDYRESLRAQET